ncbi:MAG: BON domain-containing protein [Verrucomicrobia bacterium]|nr:BON domain-containing protein [Verrucomicrobiota bacterium]
MKEFFIGLLLGIVLTLATVWYFAVGRSQPGIRQAQNKAAAKVQQTVETVDAKLTAWHLTTPEIKTELARTGKVMRRSALDWGERAAHVASDAAVTARIKAKLAADGSLSALSISVNTTDGRVTLAGAVTDHAHISKAMSLALETEGVRDVTSTLQVRK